MPELQFPGCDLQPLNTLATPARCDRFARVQDEAVLEEVMAFAREQKLPVLVLGGGSNIVLGEHFPGLVVQIAIPGYALRPLDEERAVATVGAGEEWHPVVEQSVTAGWSGLENLALIPGCVGAAPIQNIGAYGVELESVLNRVRVYDPGDGTFAWMERDACKFGYRDSIFKRELRDRVIITAVELLFDRRFEPKIDYAPLAEWFAGRLPASPAEVMQAVIAIRRERLPDPAELPNAGSFFKNPVVDVAEYEALCARFGPLSGYPSAPGTVKLAAAQLIDRLGWRGFRDDGVGVHERQALVLVNPGRRPARELLDLAQRIAASVEAEFGVALEIEPRVVSI